MLSRPASTKGNLFACHKTVGSDLQVPIRTLAPLWYSCWFSSLWKQHLSTVRKTYSGRYGDLAATTAAILLHDEARIPRSPSDGALREPLLKFIHVMRSLEYKDRDPDRMIILKNLQDCWWPWLEGMSSPVAISIFTSFWFFLLPRRQSAELSQEDPPDSKTVLVILVPSATPGNWSRNPFFVF